MRKFLTFFLTALLAFGVGWAETVTLDFSINDWGLPVGSINTEHAEQEFTNGTYTVKFYSPGSSSSTGYYYHSSGYTILGKAGAKLTLPAFDKKVTKIEVTGRDGASAKVTQNIYVGSNDEASTETTGATGTNYYLIKEQFQAVGTIYNLKITNNYNTQIVRITIYLEDGDTPSDDPLIEVSPDPLSFNDEGGTISVNAYNMPDNGLGVSVTNGFARELLSPGVNAPDYYFPLTNNSIENAQTKVTYTGNELIADGTITYASGSESKSAALNYRSDIYIVNNHGDDSWNFNEGVKMTYSDGVYTGTIVATNPNTKIVFARLLGNDVSWNNRLVFGADSYGDWVYGTFTGGNLKLSDDIAIKFPNAGAYTITINPVAKTFSITSTGVYNIAEAQAFEDGTFTYMGSAVATYQHGQNLWIRDDQGNSGLIYGNVDTFANGDSLAIGWTAENELYINAIPQFKNPNGVTNAGNNGTVAPYPLTTIELTDINKYASMSNVTITRVDGQNYYIEVNGNEYLLRDNRYNTDLGDLKKDHVYNVVGVVSAHDGVAQLNLISAEDITPKEMTVTLDPSTKTATAGETIPVTVNVEDADGDYTVTYKIGVNGTETTLTGDVINVTSQTAGEVKLYVTVTSNDKVATAEGTYTFTEPVQPGSNVFKKVESLSELEAGKKYIFVDRGYAMGAVTTYGTPVAVTELDATHVEIDDNVTLFTLGQVEGQSNYYTLTYTNNNGDDQLLKVKASNSGDFSTTTEYSQWRAFNTNGGYGFKNTLTSARAIIHRYSSTNNRFAFYAESNLGDEYTYALIYVQTASTPVPDPMTIELTTAPEEAYTVGDNVTVTATVEHGSESTVVTYKINNGEEQIYAAPGIVLPNTAAGAIVVTVKATDGNNVATDTVTYHFNAAEAFAITLTATPAQETYEVGSTVNVKVNVENAIGENLTITYTIGETRANETYDPATGINITSATADTVPLTVNVADGYQHAGESTATASYVFVKKTMGLAFAPTSVQVYEGQEVTEPELKNLPEGLTVAYSSSNATVASVDAEGNVTAAAPGEAIITAKFAGNDVYEADSASYTITVLAKKAAGLTYGEEPIVFNVKVGDDIEEPTLANPNDLTVTYESSDTTVAKVDNLGNVSIVGAGTAVITAKSEATTEYLAGEARYTINVTKKNATVTFSEHAYTVYVGNDFTPPTLTTDPVGLDVEYRIEGDVNAVLFDESDGTVVIGDEPGTVTITATFAGNATYNEASDSYTITVKAKEIASLSFDVEGITVYPNAEDFDQPDLTTTPTGLAVEYTSSDDDIATVVDGELIIGEKTGTATITAKFNGNDTYGAASATYTVTVEPRPIVIADEDVEFTLYVGETDSKTIDVAGENLKGDITLTLNDETGFFTINPTTIAKADAENATVTVTYAPTTEGIHEATVTISTPDALENVTVTLTGMATVRPVAAKPTFSPVPGSYTSAQTVTIGCETPGATIRYTVNGETTEATAPVTITLTDDANIEAVAIVNGMTNSEVAAGQYVIDLPTTLPDVTPFKGYYFIKNNGNNQYANIAGRKTLNFTSTPDKMAGTVFWLETNNKGQVQSLRSQGADLQGYADRAMRYVPTMVKMVVDKLHAEGAGTGILGENGYEEIMAKFDTCFDHHLYVEQAEGGWRLYGKTPNMQHVVDFYREHTNQVEAKLPMLEDFINDALTKLRNKMGGQSIFTPFSVHQIWHRMDSALVDASLTEPVDSASTMTFYREVLNNKNYVWSFAYQTAQIYWTNVKNHPRYEELKDKLGEYADYLDEFVNQIRPDFKYYVIQRGNEPDYISEGNKEILDNKPWTIWTLTPREDFTVTVTTENMAGCQTDPKYVTTLYTDFAYTLPTGIKAYKVKDVTKYGNIVTEVINGVIPAQTPVLLMADEAGDYVLTLTTEAGTPVTNNLLVGVDALITRFQLKTPIVVDMFNYAQGFLGDLYDQYVKDYEYLQLLYAGTVNNKYFWGLSNDDVEKCVYINNDGDEDCVIRNLADGKFTNNWKSPETNKAFLMSETFNSIGLYQKGDVNHDGTIDVQDVSMTINYVLGKDNNEEFFCTICADVNNDGIIDVDDVTLIINITLGK